MIALVLLFACLFWGPLLASAATLFTWAYGKGPYGRKENREPANLAAVFGFWYLAVVVFIVGGAIITGVSDARP
jgi:hypothetical protein